MSIKAALIPVAFALVLFNGLAVQAEGPKGPKHSPAHDAAVQKCSEAYDAAVAAAHTPNSPTGKARFQAMHAASEAKKACVAKAPK